MERRTFLKIGGGVAGAMLVPVFGNAIAAEELLNPMALSFKKALADAGLNAATKAGASYCDVRIGRYLNQFITTRDLRVENIVNTESSGVGVRVVAGGAYGFAATNDMSPDGVAGAARQAVAIARANAKLQSEPLQLAPVKGVGEVSWATPFTRDWRAVPVKDKAEMLIAASKAGLDAGASFMTANLFQVNQQKYFASTDGSYIDQDIHRLWAPMTATAVDKVNNRFRTRDSLAAPVGMGFEYFDARAADKVQAAGGVATLYTRSVDLVEDARAAGRQAKEKLSAKSVEPGKYDLVLSPEHLFLTIHESVGHPTELDRVLGYEANYAGTSFATLDKWQTKKFKFGADRVNFIADKTTPGSLGAVGYDDEGVRVQALGHHQGRRAGELPGHARPGPHHRREGIARLLVRGQLEQRAVPAHAERVAGGRQGAAHARRDGQGRQEGHLHPRARFVFDRPAALQLPVRRPALLRDQERQDRRPARRRRLPVEHPGILERLQRHLRPARLAHGRLVLRRQRPAVARSAPSRTARPPPASTAST